MDENEQKQQLSVAYLHAVASAAGYAWQTPAVDDDSVDRVIVARGWVDEDAVHYSPRIDVQLKSLTRPPLTTGEAFFPYRLKKKNYDDLRHESPMVPRLLVVLVLPEISGDWVSQGHKRLTIRYAAYYLSLCGMPERKDVKYKVTVAIPRKNLLSVNNLRRLMAQASRGGRKLE
ncbi:MAG: DUF4365 domain-containing protein [Gemmataceae bacterium]|nr:DUF4365 domain-containing protein [Gemmataceae bacterium]